MFAFYAAHVGSSIRAGADICLSALCIDSAPESQLRFPNTRRIEIRFAYFSCLMAVQRRLARFYVAFIEFYERPSRELRVAVIP